MLNLSAFNHNHHASRVKMVAKFIRRGIRVANILGIFLNFIEVTGYTITVTTGLIMGIITYFVTRKQVEYLFGKSRSIT